MTEKRDLKQIQVDGYEWALRRQEAIDDSDIDAEVQRRYGVRWGDPDPTKQGSYEAVYEAFDRGVRDTLQLDNGISVAEAAAMKGVSVQSIRDVLRDDTRRKNIFPSAVFIGDNPRRGEWRLSADEVQAWKPRRTGAHRPNDEQQQ